MNPPPKKKIVIRVKTLLTKKQGRVKLFFCMNLSKWIACETSFVFSEKWAASPAQTVSFVQFLRKNLDLLAFFSFNL